MRKQSEKEISDHENSLRDHFENLFQTFSIDIKNKFELEHNAILEEYKIDYKLKEDELRVQLEEEYNSKDLKYRCDCDFEMKIRMEELRLDIE